MEAASGAVPKPYGLPGDLALAGQALSAGEAASDSLDARPEPVSVSDPRPLGAGYRAALTALAMVAGAAVAAVVLSGHDGSPVAAICAALWWVAVVVVVRSDLEAFIIPDEASMAIAFLGLFWAVGLPVMAGADWDTVAEAALAALLNGAAGFALFWLVAWAYRRFSGREGLGFGDVKLAGASALWLDPPDAAVALEIAALAALAMTVARRGTGPVRDHAIPFGAFLAPAAWIAFLSAPAIHTLLGSLD